MTPRAQMVCGAAGEPCVKGSSGLGHGAQGWSRLVFRLLVPKWQNLDFGAAVEDILSHQASHLAHPPRILRGSSSQCAWSYRLNVILVQDREENCRSSHLSSCSWSSQPAGTLGPEEMLPPEPGAVAGAARAIRGPSGHLWKNVRCN